MLVIFVPLNWRVLLRKLLGRLPGSKVYDSQPVLEFKHITPGLVLSRLGVQRWFYLNVARLIYWYLIEFFITLDFFFFAVKFLNFFKSVEGKGFVVLTTIVVGVYRKPIRNMI